MHIVQILPELTQGGVERYVIELSRELVRLGHSCTVISAGGSLAHLIEKSGGRHITLNVCSKNPLTVLQRVASLRQLLADLSPDVLHVHSRVPAWLARLANRTLCIPFVTTVHGFNHVGNYSRIMTQGDRVICVSNPIKQYIQEHYATENARISVIPCGVDPVDFDPDRLDQDWIDNFKKTFGLENKQIVTTVGRISRSKDYETFLRGIAICAKDDPNIRGLIIGGSRRNNKKYGARLNALAHQLGIEDQIVFAGNQTRLPEIYSLSQMVVSSSKTPETFGLTLIEAMAMNTPVIATRHGGPLDIIQEGVNGLLFEPENAKDLAKQIFSTLSAPLCDLRAKTIQSFSAMVMTEAILTVYQNCLNQLHIVQVLPELNQGGVERGAIELNRELVQRGHLSTVISAGGTQASQIEKDGGRHIPLDVCSKNPLTAPFRILALRRTLRGMRPTPHILHARSRVPAWLCHFANKPFGLPFVTTVHGFNSVSKYSEIMTSGDRVIYGSPSIKDYVVENYPIDESKLRYVPRGIDTHHFDPDSIDPSFIKAFKQEHDLNGKTIITIVGRITEWKGHDTFIRALGEVNKTRPDVVGVVAGGIWHGKDEFFQGLENLATELGANIRFVGSQSQVREIYALSNLVVSAASTKAETFGRTAAEALAMNTPVIASAQGGSLDLILDGENGFFFEPGNAEDLTKKIEQALAFEFSNMRDSIQLNFSLDHMVKTELSVYRELLPNPE